MRARALLTLLAVLATVGLCARLGVWQVARMHEKERLRAAFDSTLAATPQPVDVIAGAAGTAHPKVSASGRYDDAHQILLSARSHDGETGVDVVTPLLLGDGRAVLVDRGWLPAEDAMTARPQDFPEPGEREVVGLARTIPATSGPTRWLRLSAETDRTTLWSTYSLSRDSLAARLPFAVLGVLIEQLPGPGVPPVPRRDAPERPDPSVHFWYAVQWFAVALIAGAGSIAVWRRGRPARPSAP